MDDETSEVVVIFVVLHAHAIVALAFFEEVRKRVEEIVPALEHDVDYTAEMLCGKDYWKSMSARCRRMAGMCIAFMVRQEMLPLVCSACPHQYPKPYRPK